MIAVNGTSQQAKQTAGVNSQANGSRGGSAAVGRNEVVLGSTRRRFSIAYKRQIVAEAEACQHGQLGALLRREGIYSSYLAQWRRELAADKLSAAKKRPSNVERKRLEELEKENAQLRRELKKAEAIITAQKKLAALIDIMNESE